MNSRDSNRGVTLLEMAIVIFIITAIVAAVLVARTLLDQVVVNSQIKQVEEYRVAMRVFELKYNAFPGDYAKASQHGLGPNGNGNGNGIIGDIIGEGEAFYAHLSQAGLINYDISLGRYPLAKVGVGNVGLYYNVGDGRSYFHVGVLDDELLHSLTPLQAYKIELKMDDGDPFANYILASGAGPIGILGLPPTVGPPGDDSDVCINIVTNEYNYQADARLCSLDIDIKHN